MKTIAIMSFIASIWLMPFTMKPADDKYTVDKEKSTLEWLCKKAGGQHIYYCTYILHIS